MQTLTGPPLCKIYCNTEGLWYQRRWCWSCWDIRLHTDKLIWRERQMNRLVWRVKTCPGWT